MKLQTGTREAIVDFGVTQEPNVNTRNMIVNMFECSKYSNPF